MQNKIILIVGPKGTGKTYTVNQAIANMERVVIYDMIHEKAYSEHATIITGRPRDLAREIAPGKQSFKVTYRPTMIQVEDNGLVEGPEFSPITKLVYLRGDCYYIIDEAHLLCNSRNCPNDLMIANLLGRHRRLSLVLVAQSFTGIHPAIRKNADEFMFWRIIEPSDLEGIRERCGRDVEQQVRSLRVLERSPDGALIAPGQCLKWDKLRGVVEVTK